MGLRGTEYTAMVAVIALVLAACGSVQSGEDKVGLAPVSPISVEDRAISVPAGADGLVPEDDREQPSIAAKDRKAIHSTVTGASQSQVDAAEKQHGVRLCGPNELVLNAQRPLDVAEFDSLTGNVAFTFNFRNTSSSVCVRPDSEDFQIYGSNNELLGGFMVEYSCLGGSSCLLDPGEEYAATMDWNRVLPNADTEVNWTVDPGEYTVVLVLNFGLVESLDGVPVRRPLSRSLSTRVAFVVAK